MKVEVRVGINVEVLIKIEEDDFVLSAAYYALLCCKMN